MQLRYSCLFENRGSFISVHVLLNLLNNLSKSDKMLGLSSIFIAFSLKKLLNSIKQEQECWILYII